MSSVLDLAFPKPAFTVTPYVTTVEQTKMYAEAVQHIRLTLTNFVVDIDDSSGEYGGNIVCYLPDQNINILNAEVNLSVVKGNASGGIGATDDITMGVGTAVASNNTLSTTMQNIIPVTSITTDSLTVSFQASMFSSAGTGGLLSLPDSATTAIYLNGTATGSVMSADDTLTCTGTIDIWAIPLGNINS